MSNSSRQATSLRPGQFRHLLRVAGVTGRMPERDQMVLWLTHTTGIRVTELALLRLYSSGAIREGSTCGPRSPRAAAPAIST